MDAFLTLLLSQQAMQLGIGLAAAYGILWVVLRLVLRRLAVTRDLATVVHLAFFTAAAELLKTAFPAGSLPVRGLLTLQLALLAFLTVHVVIKIYFGQYLEQRHIVISRIIRDLIKFFILIFFALLFMRYVLRLNLATILTPSAIFTAIIGLSMQDTFGNLVAGIIIQLEKPFDIGDWIEIDGQKAQVKEINWRYTKVETMDAIYIIIPNNKICTDRVINYNKPTTLVRQHLIIGVDYSVPPFRVKRAILDILKANPHITHKERSAVFLNEYGDSSVNYSIDYFISNIALHRVVRDDIYSAVWYQFQKHGINIPFPVRTVIMKPESQALADVSAITGLLATFPFFENVSRESIEHLARFGLLHSVEADHALVQDGEAGESMFFILEGEFRVLKDKTQVATLKTGNCFGEMSLLTGETRNARIESIAHGRLLEIDRSAFKILIESEPSIMRRIEKVFEERALSAKDAPASAGTQDAIKKTFYSRFRQLFGME